MRGYVVLRHHADGTRSVSRPMQRSAAEELANSYRDQAATPRPGASWGTVDVDVVRASSEHGRRAR